MTEQDLLALGFRKTPDGKMFLPFSLTDIGRRGIYQPGGTSPEGENFEGYYAGVKPSENGGMQAEKFANFEDAFRSYSPEYWGASFGNNQNLFTLPANSTPGQFNGEYGYTFDPSQLSYGPTNYVTGSGWKGLRDEFVIPALTAYAGSQLAGGAESSIGGSSGSESLVGSAGADALGSGETLGSGLKLTGSGAGAGAGSTAAASGTSSGLWGSVIGSLVGAGANILSSNKAADTQSKAAEKASETQLGMFNQNRADLAPWRTAGEQSVGDLSAGIAPGGELVRKFTMADFENDPVTQASFRFGMDEGTKAISRAFGARGMLRSGSAIKALERFASDYAGQRAAESYNRFVGDQTNVFNKRASVAGLGQTAATQTAQLGANAATNIANLDVGAANARGAASIAAGNAVSGAASNIGSAYQRQSYLDSMNRPYYYMG